VPSQLVSNNIFGDIVEQIINLNFEPEKPLVSPEVPNHMPLKLAVIGRSFTGKKLQAQILAEKFNLNIYKPEDLINEALERSEEEFESLRQVPDLKAKRVDENPQGEDSQPQEPQNDAPETADPTGEEAAPTETKPAEEETETKKEGEMEMEVIKEEEELEREVDPDLLEQVETITRENMEAESRNKFREIGRMFKASIMNGEEIDMSLVVDLLVTKIKLQYEYISKEKIIETTRKNIQREDEIK
jgi:hypothetical protein